MAKGDRFVQVSPKFLDLIDKLGEDIDGGFFLGMTQVMVAAEGHALDEVPIGDTSNLHGSITNFVLPSGLEGILKATAPYALFVHGGTKPHKIRAKNKKALFWFGARHPVKSVNHPGTKPDPFFDRALDKTDIQGEFDGGMQVFLNGRGW